MFHEQEKKEIDEAIADYSARKETKCHNQLRNLPL